MNYASSGILRDASFIEGVGELAKILNGEKFYNAGGGNMETQVFFDFRLQRLNFTGQDWVDDGTLTVEIPFHAPPKGIELWENYHSHKIPQWPARWYREVFLPIGEGKMQCVYAASNYTSNLTPVGELVDIPTKEGEKPGGYHQYNQYSYTQWYRIRLIPLEADAGQQA